MIDNMNDNIKKMKNILFAVPTNDTFCLSFCNRFVCHLLVFNDQNYMKHHKRY